MSWCGRCCSASREAAALRVARTTADSAVAPTYAKALCEREGPAVRQHIEIMRAAGIDPMALSIGGQLIAELFVGVARRAVEPLTRAALIAAAESTRDRELGLAAGPITIGPNDHRPLESFRMARADMAQRCFSPIGPTIRPARSAGTACVPGQPPDASWMPPQRRRPGNHDK